MYILERVVLCAGEIVRETEGSREMGIVDSLRWVVMERMAGERGMGQRDEGWRRDGSWTRRRWRRVAGTAMLSKPAILSISGGENEDEKGKKDKRKIEIDSSDTLTGPVQLLQIWAYSRMAFVRPNDHYIDIQLNFEFPLYRPWIKSISKFRPPMNLKDRRDQLDNMKHEEFIWSPYEEIIDKLTKMVPVPFQMPFDRADKAKKSLADYSISMKEVIAIWEKREETVVRGESDASPMHEDSYMMRYASVTWLRIAPPLKEKVDNEQLTPTHATKGDDELLTPTHATKGDDEPLTPTHATKGDDEILIPQKPGLFSMMDELSSYCTTPPPKKLKKLLSREWMDMGILQNWFDVNLKAKAPNAYFIEANASDMMYYRCRLVVDLYIKQRELYEKSLKSSV
ncbi:hypothetical protein MRB53_032550 [Persea americana]|uniref:Uncharacterized protein n=1 Tax=Persea americana TaxID=3435 RepID=A0ACC2KSP3_PERAE|nr:hypothetical protein MRB53_032550 [Persea americana]